MAFLFQEKGALVFPYLCAKDASLASPRFGCGEAALWHLPGHSPAKRESKEQTTAKCGKVQLCTWG
jgi:hypothetical protein